MISSKSTGYGRELANLGGYSSLAYVKRLPIDQLKIDRSFVNDVPTDLNSVAICGAIIGLGNSLGFDVVAEGVETDVQWEYLKGVGCAIAQGYLFCRPLPPNEIPARLGKTPGSQTRVRQRK